jgi:signal peptidase complex subunit 3
VNQVVLWDRIITRQADAHIQLPSLRQKYAFVDMGRRLRDRRLNLTLRWNVMPRVGALYTGEASFPAGPLPSAYLH